MFKLLWAAVAGGSLGSWAILALVIVGALGAAAGSGAYVAHRMDLASYTELELKQAKAQLAQSQANIEALQKFEKDKVAADQRAADALAELASARAQYAKDLQAAFKLAGAKDANLAMCLRMPLPSGVLNNLSH
jgi:hypothetical protein